MLKSFYSRQARNPTGLFGRLFMSRIFDKGNAPLNERMLELVAAGGDDRILEIGFGPGGCLRKMARALDGGPNGGVVEGIDTSKAMMRLAEKRNRAHLDAGKMRLVMGDFDAEPYPEDHFDTVCSANTIYFWPDQRATMAKIHAVLKPGGRLVLAFVDKRKMEAMPLDMDVFTAVSHEDVLELLREAGFDAIARHMVGDNEAMICMEARKRT